MKPEKYQQFTQQLLGLVASKKHVIGLVAVGSMAAGDYLPDEWSDHDFFLIVQPGRQEEFRTAFHWLPQREDIVYSYRETAHGVKVLYRNAHLLEFAVFDPDELNFARINRYRILLDRGNLAVSMEKIRHETEQHTEQPDPEWLFGQFLSNLLVGVGRYRRGEQLSGHVFVRYNAMRSLAMLCHRYFESSQKKLLDNLDPFRRLEFVFPDEGATINDLLQKNTPDAAAGLLEFADEKLRRHIPHYPVAAVQTVQEFLKVNKINF